jgi:hypothetical protein
MVKMKIKPMKRVVVKLVGFWMAAGLLAILAVVGYGVGVAKSEEKGPKVLTVEKLAGPEVVVNDTVAASLETGTKAQFVKSDGEVSCSESKLEGKVMTNPESGTGNSEIKIETFPFGTCTTTLPGTTVRGVAIETLPLIAETEGTNAFKIKEMGFQQVSVEIKLEVAGVEKICVYRTSGALKATYRNNNEGEIEVEQTLDGGFFNKRNCACPPPSPTWKAKYRPLRDETGGRKEKQIFIN